MINFALAKEIYGLTPWMMDLQSLPAMSSILQDIKRGVRFEQVEEKLNSIQLYDFKNDVKIIDREYHLNNNLDFEAIAIVNLNGPITLSGGMSTEGMEQISSKMLRMNQDDRVKAFLFLGNSGGGSSSAVEVMSDTINEVKKTKPVYMLVTKGGMLGSAAYGIGSATDKIYSESGMNIVGSIGTMIQFEGKEANSTDKDGTKNIRLYATKSVLKNKGFEEALNNDNYTVLIDELLDPINENFIEMISTNRPAITSTTFDDGAVHFSKDVVGSFVDGIASFSEVVEFIKADTKFSNNNKEEFRTSTNNKNNVKMTKAEFKTANPTAYAEIVAEGIAQEKDRVGAWMAHADTDIASVKAGVEGTETLSQTQREKFFVKQNSKNKVSAIVEESADDVNPDESLTDVKKIANQKKDAEIKSAFGFELT
jgi:ClpP class serine protease